MRASWRAVTAAGVLAAGVTGVAAVLGDQAPYPYAQRHLLDIPLPLLTGRRLDVLLQPRQSERVLEIGPGTGLQSLHVAPQLGRDGELAVVDIQQQMLDHVMAHVTLPRLIRMANEVRLSFRCRTGVPGAYYALLVPQA